MLLTTSYRRIVVDQVFINNFTPAGNGRYGNSFGRVISVDGFTLSVNDAIMIVIGSVILVPRKVLNF
jgi:hypothetical protein